MTVVTQREYTGLAVLRLPHFAEGLLCLVRKPAETMLAQIQAGPKPELLLDAETLNGCFSEPLMVWVC